MLLLITDYGDSLLNALIIAIKITNYGDSLLNALIIACHDIVPNYGDSLLNALIIACHDIVPNYGDSLLNALIIACHDIVPSDPHRCPVSPQHKTQWGKRRTHILFDGCACLLCIDAVSEDGRRARCKT